MTLTESQVKETNPKDALGVQKTPLFSVMPLNVLARIVLGMLEGALKYARHNYRVKGVRASVYVDAAVRHIAQFWEGEDLDTESKAGLHHIDKALSTLTVFRDAMLNGKWVDDRPPALDAKWLEENNKISKGLVKNFPNPPPPYTETNKNEPR